MSDVADGNGKPLLEARDLRVEIEDGTPIVHDVSLSLRSGEILGVVGESGSGKTTTALAMLGYTMEGVKLTGGEVTVAGERFDGRREDEMRRLRGRLVSFVPQDPGIALNPSLRIGAAMRDVVQTHWQRGPIEEAVRTALHRAELPDTPEFVARFPHQLSGGQQQRVCIAMALSCEPPVVVLDEPTTGLDVVTQARILEEIERLRDDLGVSMIYVTHDLAVVAQVADRVAVMYSGRIVEQGPVADVLERPRHPYTRGLLLSIPDHHSPRQLEAMPGVAAGVGADLPGCAFAPRCPLRIDRCEERVPDLEIAGAGHVARCIRWADTPALAFQPAATAPERTAAEPLLQVAGLNAEYRSRRETVRVVDDVSFTVERGSCLALVGESGSGKTTIARVVAGLHPPVAGSIRLGEQTLAGAARKRTVDQRRRIQLIFQNPADALNPRHTVRSTIARPARQLRGISQQQAEAEVDELLDQVRLPRRLAGRYPGELSGGERQRVGIARALAARPDLLVCDEITSALDVSVQAAVLELLADLRADLGLSLLFITHNLGVVSIVAESMIVLEKGVICEHGDVRTVLSEPEHPYTQRLLASAPSIALAAAEPTGADG